MHPTPVRAVLAVCVAGAIVWLAGTGPALAHASERGIVLLLPTGHYVVGGALAVAASFLVLLRVPHGAMLRLAVARLDLGTLPRPPRAVLGTMAFLLLLLLLAAGWAGSRDPLRNPLPLTIWTLWWTGLTIAQAAFGNLWHLMNPWVVPGRLLRRLLGRRPTAYPRRLAFWPAIAAFGAFAWFELVDPAPDDPARLATVAAAYSVYAILGVALFGERAWLSRAECFTVFFGFVARLSPLRVGRAGPGYIRLWLVVPGAALARAAPLPASGVLFVLLTLGSVSFDGLDETFWWLGLGGINPLEYPGRTELAPRNTLGLLGVAATLVCAYATAVAVGARLAGIDGGRLFGALVLSIVPISIGYHFAHYLTAFAVDIQYAVLALADPFALGWWGAEEAHRRVSVSFLADYDAVSVIWKLQAAGVVGGHVLAVAVGHAAALRAAGARHAGAVEAPLTVLMIAYTVFGLWLLSTPTAG